MTLTDRKIGAHQETMLVIYQTRDDDILNQYNR